MTFVLKTYQVRVLDFWEDHTYLGRNAAQARAKAWRSYCSYNAISFRDFLKISTLRRVPNQPGLGHLIEVGGLPAHWCGDNGQYVLFCRPHGDLVMLSHPLDVKQVADAA